MTPDEFRMLGHALIDWVADYRERIRELPVKSTVMPGKLRDALPPRPPTLPEGLSRIIVELDELILPGITHWNHPRFFAYFPSNSSLSSVLADLISSGLGAQAMSWQTSPAATELEEHVLDWLRQLIGLPESFKGVIQDTASSSTLVALLCARERTSNFSQERDGTTRSPLTVYASVEAHSSVTKAARLAGFGASRIRLLPTDDCFAMDLDALDRALEDDRANGFTPCALVASIGTTATTAVDPLPELVERARRHGLWLHVDAAMAGTALLLPECRKYFEGLEHADSFVFNPHKWLGTGFDLSAYYVRDKATLLRTMSTHPSYLATAEDELVTNYRDWGIPLGRRFRALKLWFLLKEQGVAGLQARLRRDLDYAQRFASALRASPPWEVLAPVPFQTVSFRHALPWLSLGELNRRNQLICDAINDSGVAYLTSAEVQGKRLIRASFGSETTEPADVDYLWKILQHEAGPSGLLPP